MPTIHILTQYVWPDAAPTAIYAEDLATSLQSAGFEVRLVGGTGDYRALRREKPAIPIVYIDHFHGRRGSLVQTFVEYASVKRAFQKYIEEFVWRGGELTARAEQVSRSGSLVILASIGALALGALLLLTRWRETKRQPLATQAGEVTAQEDYSADELEITVQGLRDLHHADGESS